MGRRWAREGPTAQYYSPRLAQRPVQFALWSSGSLPGYWLAVHVTRVVTEAFQELFHWNVLDT